MGYSAGIAYLENRTRCPYDAKNQVKHVEHQAVEKLRYGDEEGVMKSSLDGRCTQQEALTVITML